MAKAKPLHVTLSPECSTLAEPITTLLREHHGAHGLRLHAGDDYTEQPDLAIQRTEESDYVALIYGGEPHITRCDDIERAISSFALSGLALSLGDQTSRTDTNLFLPFMGHRPNVAADPSEWLFENELMKDLTRKFPDYGNLIRFVCNERGLFMKAGNIPAQRAHWNSTLNGGLPAFKKSDPIHEGTFLLHDIFHFVPVDPLLGEIPPDDQQIATYLAHRQLSEASTLVLADMVAVSHADLENRGYDVARRKIYPIYKSILESNGGEHPDIERLLAANAYFSLTADATGFRNLGASVEAIEFYQSKYERIFKDDFSWNLHNIMAMVQERRDNPLFEEYYGWVRKNLDAPSLDEYSEHMSAADGATDIARMVSEFRAGFIISAAYPEALSEDKRRRKAYAKYLAGQRVVFARFGQAADPSESIDSFDAAFNEMQSATDDAVVVEAGNSAIRIAEEYIDRLAQLNLLLPHEVATYKFSVPLYPILFINYELPNNADLLTSIRHFSAVNARQLQRLLEKTESH